MKRLPLFIAGRYLFAKRRANAINLIAGVAVVGVTFGAAAFIVILSAFNGFEELIGKLYNTFNPDIKIQSVKGKVLQADSSLLAKIEAVEGVEGVSATLNETALFTYKETQSLGTIKGVDHNFLKVNKLDSAIVEGSYKTQQGDAYYAVMAAGMAYRMAISADDASQAAPEGFTVYMPKRVQSSGSGFGASNTPFKTRLLYPAGIFDILQDFSNYVITDLDFVRELLQYDGTEASAIEVRLKNKEDYKSVQKSIKQAVGDEYAVLNHYEQDATFYKVTNMERWVGYAILCFAFLIVIFNTVGALAMLVMEKKQDISILRAMGADSVLIRNIFLFTGLLLTTLGTLLGFVLAFVLCKLQQNYGFLKLEGSGDFITNIYPVSMRVMDFVLIFFTILVIGFVASWYPARYAAKQLSIEN